MRCKLLIAITVIIATLTTSCSIAEKLIYNPNINQGNYLSSNDLIKIKKGMTEEQVIYLLGTPMLKELFGEKIWYYVFRQQLGREKINQHTLKLTFNNNGILIDIKNNDLAQ
ncbi:MAG: outer membrane protein assembly factor BamE [Arsenophonus sp.]